MVDRDSIPTDKITLRWLHDHVPISWWFWIVGVCAVIFGGGMTAAQWKPVSSWFAEYFSTVDERKLGEARSQITELEEDILSVKERNEKLEQSVTRLRSENEGLKRSFETQIDKNSEIHTRMESLKKENHLLRTEIDALKSKLSSLNAQIPKTKNEKGVDEIADQPSANAIIESLSNMYSSHVSGFLIEIIPTIKGGVSCDDLATMISHAYSGDGANVIKQVAPYVQRPFADDCFEELSNVVYSSETAGAISVLIRSKPKY